MRVAVVTDIHANLPALEAVVAAIEAEETEQLWCLGDLVGYGAQPDDCVTLIRDSAAVCLAGNHDLVVGGAIDMSVFAADAGAAARWTVETIRPETLQYLLTLSPSGQREGVELYHASIRDPVWEYVIDERTATSCLELQSSPLALIGHSHVPLVWGYVGGRFVGGMAPGDTMLELGEGPFLLNPGSVGQPRDGDPRAAFLILDTGTGTAIWRRVEYDIARAQAAIAEAGLPLRLAGRLAEGR
ncbi:MAG TPA: metallophosphoesterase family protein [Gaiellales bacterium]|nr:metallophosphoesterase family protein [Gaiellales bacterium]